MTKILKALLPAVVVMFYVQTSLAQSENTPKNNPLKVKVYSNIMGMDMSVIRLINNSEDQSFLNDQISSFGDLSLGLAFGKQNKKWHEIEILPMVNIKHGDTDIIKTYEIIDGEKRFIHSQIIGDGDVTSYLSAVRYMYALNLTETANGRFSAFCGFSGRLHYNHISLQPKISTEFAYQSHKLGIGIGLVPGMKWKVKENIALLCDFPLQFVDLNLTYQNFENPSIPLAQQNQTTLNIDEFEDFFNVRVGLEFQLNN